MDGARRFIVIAITALGIIALVAFARNDPGVGGRDPDPPTSTTPAPPSVTTIVHVIEIKPPSDTTPGPPATLTEPSASG